MIKEQADHIHHIITQFESLCIDKYEKGQAEHGGNLWESSELYLVEEALKEAIDQVVYLITLRDKIVKGEHAR